MIDYRMNGHHVIEGTYNNAPVLTMANEQMYNKLKNTGGLPKCKNILEVLPAIIEFVLKHDPNYKLPPEIELVTGDNGQVRTVKVIKKGERT